MRPTAGFLRVADRPACPRRGPRGVGHAAPGLPGRGSRAPGRVLGASEGLGAGLGSRAPRRTPRRRAVAGRRGPTRKWRRPVSGVRPAPLRRHCACVASLLPAAPGLRAEVRGARCRRATDPGLPSGGPACGAAGWGSVASRGGGSGKGEPRQSRVPNDPCRPGGSAVGP